MYVSESQCNPHVCKYECRDACASIHGDDSPLEFGKESLHPVINEETCDKCLACIRACPLDAIRLNESPDIIPEPVPPPPDNERDSRIHRFVTWLNEHKPKSNS